MNQALENPPNVVVECTKQKKLSQSFFVSREQMRTLLKSRMASDKLSDLKENQRGRGEKLAAIFLRKLACYLSHVKRSSFFWQNICTHQRLQCRTPIIGENTNVGKNTKVSKKIKVTIQIFFAKMEGWYFGEIKPCNKPLSIQSV